MHITIVWVPWEAKQTFNFNHEYLQTIISKVILLSFAPCMVVKLKYYICYVHTMSAYIYRSDREKKINEKYR